MRFASLQSLENSVERDVKRVSDTSQAFFPASVKHFGHQIYQRFSHLSNVVWVDSFKDVFDDRTVALSHVVVVHVDRECLRNPRQVPHVLVLERASPEVHRNGAGDHTVVH